MRQYRRAVLRDMEMLFNARMLRPDHPIHAYPEAARSVINYGIPDVCSKTRSELVDGDFDEHVKKVLEQYEPRISSRSISIKRVTSEDAAGLQRIGLEIEGELWAEPYPDHLFVKTELDLESGQCTLEGDSIG